LWGESESGIPVISIAPHAYTHDINGGDPVYITIPQVNGLSDIVNMLPQLLSADTSATVSGYWEFANTLTADILTAPKVTVNSIQFTPMVRPDDLAIGEIYMDIDNQLYLQTVYGTKPFTMAHSTSPWIRVMFAQARTYIMGTTVQALGQARTTIYRMGFAGAQGIVRTQYKNTGMSRVKIARHIVRTSQAQAIVSATMRYRYQAQALAIIYTGKDLVGLGQSFANIEVPYPKQGFSQAEAKINAFAVMGHANAIAFIDYI
jgi:hypothetical protein